MSIRPRVLYVQYTNPAAYPPIEHGAHILANAGFDVLMLGVRLPQGEMHVRPHEHITVRLLPHQSRGWRQKLHYAWFTAWVMGWVIRWRPEWVYASDALSAPVAAMAKSIAGRRVIYHEHDAPADLARATPSAFMRFILRARQQLTHRADLCVLPNEGRAAALERPSSSTIVTVWNCPSRDEVTPSSTRPGANTLRVLYQGTIVPARVPVTVIEALAALPDTVSLTIVGYETAGHSGYTQALLAVAHGLGVGHRVSYAGLLSREEMLRHSADYDVGLSLMPAEGGDLNERTMVGASNKPFDYLACGLPVLVSDLPEWRETYVDAGLGRACRPASAASIADALRWFLAHPAERVAMGERGRARILQDWNYETRFAPVLARLEAVAS